MATTVNPLTNYAQQETAYYYCNVCGRKDYRLQIYSSNGTGNAAVTTCNGWNTAPCKYPQTQCLGTMTAGSTAQTNLNNLSTNDAWTSS